MTLADRIKAAMRAAEITQAELARRTGLSRGAISMWCSGTTQTIDGNNLVLAAEALGVTAKWLSTGKGPQHPASGSSEALAAHETRAAYTPDHGLIYAKALQDAVRAIADRAGVDLKTLITDSDEARQRIADAIAKRPARSEPSAGRLLDLDAQYGGVTDTARIKK